MLVKKMLVKKENKIRRVNHFLNKFKSQVGFHLTFDLFKSLVKDYEVSYFPTLNNKIVYYGNLLLADVERVTSNKQKLKLLEKINKQIFWVEFYLLSLKKMDLTIRNENVYDDFGSIEEIKKQYYDKVSELYKTSIAYNNYLIKIDELDTIEAREVNFYNKWITQIKKKKKCILHYKSSNSNYFITLTDLKFKVLGSFSTGRMTESNNKKRKVSPLLVYPIMNKVIDLLRKNKVRTLILYVKSNITRHVYNTLWILKNNGILVEQMLFLKPIPHHFGQKKKKQRRI